MQSVIVSAPRDPDARERGAAWRTPIAWLAVGLTLGLSIFGGVQSGSAGLAVGVSTLAGNATDALQGLGQAVPLGYAFAVGMASAVNPCGFALLPAYLGLYLGAATGDSRSWREQLKRALLVSAMMTASFVAVFGAVGLALGAFGTLVGSLMPWLSIGVGVLLVIAGGRLIAGSSLAAPSAERMADALGKTARNGGIAGYATYGLAYALSSVGCTLPLFLAVVGTGLARGGLVGGLEQFVLYAFGMGAVVAALTVLVAVLGRSVLTRVRSA